MDTPNPPRDDNPLNALASVAEDRSQEFAQWRHQRLRAPVLLERIAWSGFATLVLTIAQGVTVLSIALSLVSGLAAIAGAVGDQEDSVFLLVPLMLAGLTLQAALLVVFTRVKGMERTPAPAPPQTPATPQARATPQTPATPETPATGVS